MSHKCDTSSLDIPWKYVDHLLTAFGSGDTSPFTFEQAESEVNLCSRETEGVSLKTQVHVMLSTSPGRGRSSLLSSLASLLDGYPDIQTSTQTLRTSQEWCVALLPSLGASKPISPSSSPKEERSCELCVPLNQNTIQFGESTPSTRDLVLQVVTPGVSPGPPTRRTRRTPWRRGLCRGSSDAHPAIRGALPARECGP